MKEILSEIWTVEDRIRVIPMGVDLQKRFTPPVNRQVTGVILFVGRLVEKKGLRYLIEALPPLLDKHPQAILRIVGDGQEKERIQERISELNLDQCVELKGAAANDVLPDIYRSSDVVVFPSVVADDGDREGFGLVLVEALGCECATIVTDLPAMRDIIRDGKSALVVPQKDSVQLAEKICRLLADDTLRRNLGEQGRAYVLKRFDWEIITSRYKKLIRSVIT